MTSGRIVKEAAVHVDRIDVRLLRSPRHIADHHVADHAPAQRADLSHRELLSDEVVQQPTLSDRRPRRQPLTTAKRFRSIRNPATGLAGRGRHRGYATPRCATTSTTPTGLPVC